MKEKIINTESPLVSIEKILQPFKKEKDFFDFVLLLGFSLEKTKEWIIAHPEKTISLKQKKIFSRLAKRRQKNEPLAYLIRKKEFFGLTFLVNKNVLIPRPETEILVEKVLENIDNSPNQKIILDIGTGSGCIIISLAHKLKKESNFYFLANDFSRKALQLARKNKSLNHTKQIDFFSDDLLGEKTIKKIQDLIKKSFFFEIILVANLPYISKKEYFELPETVKNFEPQIALLSGKDGLNHYQKLLKQLQNFSQKNPWLKWKIFWEIGHSQKKNIQKGISKIFPQSQPLFSKDLAGKWRFVQFEIK